ncbi:MAG: cupin domain-containing protein [Acidobacteriota bacterium]
MPSSAVEFEKVGATVRVLVSSRETAGDYVICEVQTTGPIELPFHRHSYEDQWIHVLAGEFYFEADNVSTVGKPGTSVMIPRESLSRVTASMPGKLVIIARPGGLDLFLGDARAALSANSPLLPIFEKHGIVLQ